MVRRKTMTADEAFIAEAGAVGLLAALEQTKIPINEAAENASRHNRKLFAQNPKPTRRFRNGRKKKGFTSTARCLRVDCARCSVCEGE